MVTRSRGGQDATPAVRRTPKARRAAPPNTMRAAVQDLVARTESLAEQMRELVEQTKSLVENQSEWVHQDESPLGRRKHVELWRARTLPGYKRGKQIFIRRSDITEYIRQGTAAPVRPTREQDAFVDGVKNA